MQQLIIKVNKKGEQLVRKYKNEIERKTNGEIIFMNDLIKKLRRDILEVSFEAKACHIGSALSCLEILADLYYNKLKEDDIFLFSKASGVAALYVILADKGYFPKEKLVEYLKNYPLASKEVPGIIHSVGSIGHGLNVAAGIALGKKLKNESGNVYCLISDGECQEGSTYEAALFIRQYNLDNLYVLIDNNGLQACGKTEDILDIEFTALDFFKNTIPNVRIYSTIKGEGVSFMENKVEWHYWNLTKELLEQALKENE